MSSILLAGVILIVLALIAVVAFRSYDSSTGVQSFGKLGRTEPDKDAEADTRWRSVKIRPGLICCEQASEMTEQIFLAREAPHLPLPECGEPECRCHYLFLDDRRSGQDRRDNLGKLADFFPTSAEDRRQLPGRRMADLLA